MTNPLACQRRSWRRLASRASVQRAIDKLILILPFLKNLELALMSESFKVTVHVLPFGTWFWFLAYVRMVRINIKRRICITSDYRCHVGACLRNHLPFSLTSSWTRMKLNVICDHPYTTSTHFLHFFYPFVGFVHLWSANLRHLIY